METILNKEIWEYIKSHLINGCGKFYIIINDDGKNVITANFLDAVNKKFVIIEVMDPEYKT